MLIKNIYISMRMLIKKISKYPNGNVDLKNFVIEVNVQNKYSH